MVNRGKSRAPPRTKKLFSCLYQQESQQRNDAEGNDDSCRAHVERELHQPKDFIEEVVVNAVVPESHAWTAATMSSWRPSTIASSTLDSGFATIVSRVRRTDSGSTICWSRQKPMNS